MKTKLALALWFFLLVVAPTTAAPAGDGQLVHMSKGTQVAGVVLFDVTYRSDGLRVRGRLFWPVRKGDPAPPPSTATPARRLPLVIFNHDGVSGISKWTARRAAELALQGYVVFAPSFRGEDGSEGTIEVAHGEVHDVLNAVRLMAGFAGVDTSRAAAVGMSHGALISVLAAEQSNAFRCVVEAYGVMDIFAWWKYLKSHGYRTDDPISLRVYGQGPTDRPQAFHVRNAVEHLAGLHVPLLILQGTIDKTVPVEQATMMQRACQKADKHCEILVCPGAQHGFLIYGGSEKSDPPAEVTGQKAAWQVMLGFLARNLR